jgi:polyisoprenoid-binding protein YceI
MRMASRGFASVVVGALSLAAFGSMPSTRAQGVYRIDQRFGAVEFTVRHLGLWRSHGMFDRFRGELLIDPDHPDATRIRVDVDAGSVSMPWDQAVTLLRSTDFFDVGEYPDISFTSTDVRQVAPGEFRVQGKLRIRGIAREQTLDARLVGRHSDKASGAETADFVIAGELRRSDFGMIADRGFISDVVDLSIHARIVLDRTVAH